MKIPYLIAGTLIAGSTLLCAQERFNTQETQVVTKTSPSSPSKPSASRESTPVSTRGKVVRLRPGEVIEVFKFQDAAGVDREAFYLPTEATRVVQLVFERQGRTDRYYLRGIRPGKTAGGIVARQWLDSKGFKPKSMADEARIQAALKASPVYIVVE